MTMKNGVNIIAQHVCKTVLLNIATIHDQIIMHIYIIKSFIKSVWQTTHVIAFYKCDTTVTDKFISPRRHKAHSTCITKETTKIPVLQFWRMFQLVVVYLARLSELTSASSQIPTLQVPSLMCHHYWHWSIIPLSPCLKTPLPSYCHQQISFLLSQTI